MQETRTPDEVRAALVQARGHRARCERYRLEFSGYPPAYGPVKSFATARDGVVWWTEAVRIWDDRIAALETALTLVLT